MFRLRMDDPDRVADTIYGTILVAAVLTTGWADEEPDAIASVVYAAATALVFWVAHAWAHTLGHKAAHGEWLLQGALARDFPLVQAAFLPLAAVLVALVLGATDDNAIEIGVWTSIGLLTVWGALAAQRGDSPSLLRTVVSALGCAALAVVMVVLKALLH